MRGKGRLVHGALETLTHTTQQVTTHSSEPHPQASGVVPSSHTMRWLLAVSCLSLSRAVPIPTSPITPAPETRAPPTVVPRAACEAWSPSLPLVASVKAPVQAAYSECWTFQCVGTVEITIKNFVTLKYYETVVLQNSDGYPLASLENNRERYIATYPANGEMTVVLNDSKGVTYKTAARFTFEWVCNTGPAVVPAAGFDASTYLTLPPAGSYERFYSEQSNVNWIIPCTGTLDFAATAEGYVTTFQFISDGITLHTDKDSFSFKGNFSVADNFIITMNIRSTYMYDGEFAFAWSCGGTRPDFPSHDLTSAPETRVPPTLVPLSPCESLSSPPLVASVKAPVQAAYSECWTFQCVGTVEITIKNFVTLKYYETVVLQNSDGYPLASLGNNVERYIATYPANGEMTVVLNDSKGVTYKTAARFTFEWVCNTGPAVVPAAGFDASTYLTLPPAGSYKRFYSEQSNVNWIIPCTGTLDFAATAEGYVTTFQFISDGITLHTDKDSFSFKGNFSVADNFIITMNIRSTYMYDGEFAFAWSCAAVSWVPQTTVSPISWTAAPTSVPWPSLTSTPSSSPKVIPETTQSPPTSAPQHLPGSPTVAPQTHESQTPVQTPLSTVAPHATRLPSPSTPTPLTAAGTATPTNLPADASLAPATPAPDTALPTTTPTNLPAGASYAPGTSAPDTALPTAIPTPAPDTATPTNLPDGASHAPGTSAPDTALPTATPTDQPAGATFAPSAPAVNALCTAGKDCRSGRLDPKATCNAGTCVCHTQGYVHPTDVPLCLLADVTVPMAFAVEYDGVEAGSLWTTATTRESFEETMSEALGIVTDMRVVVSDGGVLVVGMVRASTAKLANALSGKVDLSAALSSDGVSVSHGVTCARTDASHTVQHNGVCDAVECEGNTTLTLTGGTHTCEREAAPPQPEESGGSSNVVLYVGIGVGVLVVAVCVVAAFCCLQKKQRVKEFENPLFEMSREDAELYPTGGDKECDDGVELALRDT